MSKPEVTCRKCGGEIGEGQVFEPVMLSSVTDRFGGTRWQTNSNLLVPCRKCKSCGHTFTGQPAPAKEGGDE